MVAPSKNVDTFSEVEVDTAVGKAKVKGNWSKESQGRFHCAVGAFRDHIKGGVKGRELPVDSTLQVGGMTCRVQIKKDSRGSVRFNMQELSHETRVEAIISMRNKKH